MIPQRKFSNTKTECPKCGTRSLTLFQGSSDSGYCFGCSKVYDPKFASGAYLRKTKGEQYLENGEKTTLPLITPKQPIFFHSPSKPNVQPIPFDLIKKSLRAYAKNSLFIALSKFYNPESLEQAFKAAQIGTTKQGEAIFFLRDPQGRCLNAKAFTYGNDARKRACKYLFPGNAQGITKLFSCGQGTSNKVYIVESEKSALLLYLEAGKANKYIATGGVGGMIWRKLAPYIPQKAEVVVMPDLDSTGLKAASELIIEARHAGANICIYGLASAASKRGFETESGYDIADFILNLKRTPTTTKQPIT